MEVAHTSHFLRYMQDHPNEMFVLEDLYATVVQQLRLKDETPQKTRKNLLEELRRRCQRDPRQWSGDPRRECYQFTQRDARTGEELLRVIDEHEAEDADKTGFPVSLLTASSTRTLVETVSDGRLEFLIPAAPATVVTGGRPVMTSTRLQVLSWTPSLALDDSFDATFKLLPVTSGGCVDDDLPYARPAHHREDVQLFPSHAPAVDVRPAIKDVGVNEVVTFTIRARLRWCGVFRVTVDGTEHLTLPLSIDHTPSHCVGTSRAVVYPADDGPGGLFKKIAQSSSTSVRAIWHSTAGAEEEAAARSTAANRLLVVRYGNEGQVGVSGDSAQQGLGTASSSAFEDALSAATAAAAATTQRQRRDYLHNTHMKAYGIDLRLPFVPPNAEEDVAMCIQTASSAQRMASRVHHAGSRIQRGRGRGAGTAIKRK
eukprot:PhM_4_TR153/c0_g1_i1/m.61421